MVLMMNLIILMKCAGEYVIDDADHDGAILFRFLSTRFREKPTKVHTVLYQVSLYGVEWRT